jgi:CBS domain-containing protein
MSFARGPILAMAMRMTHQAPVRAQRSIVPQHLAIQDVMTPQPVTIGRTETLATAHELMRNNEVRHLPVLEHGELVGVVTQRDLYLLESLAGIDRAEDCVDDAMTGDAYAVAPDAPLDEVTAQMATRKVGCAVVSERGRVIGIFTPTDALRVLAGLVPDRAHRPDRG